MKKEIIILIISILFIVGVLAYLTIDFSITGHIIDGKTNIYSYTKAICNSSNFCEDYEVHCSNNRLIKLTPTGNAIQHNAEWIDPRDQEMIEGLC